jgi:hypothetical protein
MPDAGDSPQVFDNNNKAANLQLKQPSKNSTAPRTRRRTSLQASAVDNDTIIFLPAAENKLAAASTQHSRPPTYIMSGFTYFVWPLSLLNFSHH